VLRGTLLELALAADRSYMLDGTLDGTPAPTLRLTAANFGAYPAITGFAPGGASQGARRVDDLKACRQDLDAAAAPRRGSSRSRPTHRLGGRGAAGARAARRVLADALTGMEASLRFGGPETLETRSSALSAGRTGSSSGERGRPRARSRSTAPASAATSIAGECMGSIDYLETHSNNSTRGNRRCSARWKNGSRFLEWWRDMGRKLPGARLYLRTASAWTAQGWAQFGYLKMPDTAGHFSPSGANRTIASAIKGRARCRRCRRVWARLRRLIVTQGERARSVDSSGTSGGRALVYEPAQPLQVKWKRAGTVGDGYLSRPTCAGRRREAEACCAPSGTRKRPSGASTREAAQFFMFSFFTSARKYTREPGRERLRPPGARAASC